MKKTGLRSQEPEVRIKNKNLSTRYKMKTVMSCLFFAVCFLLSAVNSYASSSQITAIEIIDNAVKVKVDGAINYKLIKTSDPFKVMVDMEGIVPGKFAGRIFSQKEGITEVALAQVNSPITASRLDILLQSPADIRPEVKGDTLILSAVPAASGAFQENTKEYAQAQASAPTAEAKNSVAKEIKSTSFSKTETGIEFIIKGDAMMPEPAVFELNGRIIIDIPGVMMNASLPSTILPPVKDIKYKAEKESVRFTIDIQGKPLIEVFALDDELIVDIAFKEDMMKMKKEEAKGLLPDFKGQKTGVISLDFQDADVVPILRLLGDVSGYNIAVHPDVKGKITMKLLNVPWEHALDVILKTFNMEKVVEGNTIRIATIKAFQEEKKAVAETREIFGKAEEIETKIFTVNYANVDKVREAIEKAKILSQRGSIGVDVRTRSLIVKDVHSILGEVEKLVRSVDKQTPQVLIEARIAEVSKGYESSLGVQWGFMARPFDWQSSITGSATSGVSGGLGSPGIINLPAATTKNPDPTSAVTFGYLNAAQTLGLDVRLSAIEGIGKAKIISSPKIMTLENEQAAIKHGKKIPVSVRDKDGNYSTTYIDANLKLVVTPHVSADGSILMKIEVSKDEPDYTNKDILGNPAIDTRSAQTQVLVKNGETIVIGGILRNKASDSDSGVPGLSSVPVLGWLFKTRTVEETSEELIIFITPRIISQN
ncbi:MAG: type IV pilus secretin PilQ [Thermodesulfovibrionales bacterium]|nr:type IV pilus secretin PilQ [Thermodesulfovibrionales bacterium]